MTSTTGLDMRVLGNRNEAIDSIYLHHSQLLHALRLRIEGKDYEELNPEEKLLEAIFHNDSELSPHLPGAETQFEWYMHQNLQTRIEFHEFFDLERDLIEDEHQYDDGKDMFVENGLFTIATKIHLLSESIHQIIGKSYNIPGTSGNIRAELRKRTGREKAIGDMLGKTFYSDPRFTVPNAVLRHKGIHEFLPIVTRCEGDAVMVGLLNEGTSERDIQDAYRQLKGFSWSGTPERVIAEVPAHKMLFDAYATTIGTGYQALYKLLRG